MARIISLENIDAGKRTKHQEIHATYCIVENEGEKFFQIDTHGKSDRENPNQTSQTIQFDKNIAKKLVSILIDEFW